MTACPAWFQKIVNLVVRLYIQHAGFKVRLIKVIILTHDYFILGHYPHQKNIQLVFTEY